VKGVTCLNPQVMLSDVLRQPRVAAALEVFVEMKRMMLPISYFLQKAVLYINVLIVSNGWMTL